MHDIAKSAPIPFPTDEMPSRRRRTLGDLIGDLKDDCLDLVKEEAALAKAELKSRASRAGRATAIIAASAAAALAGLIVALIALGLFVAAALGAAFAPALAWGLLIVGATTAAAAGAAAMKASREMPKRGLVPAASLRSLRHDIAELKSALR